MCRIFAVFDFYVFYISRAHFSASLKQIPKVTTTFLSTLCEILQENQRKAQVYNNQALLMQHWFTHDNLISIQNYCLLSCRLYHVFVGFRVNGVSYSSLSPSFFKHSPYLTKQHSFSSHVSLPNKQQGMIGRHFF